MQGRAGGEIIMDGFMGQVPGAHTGSERGEGLLGWGAWAARGLRHELAPRLPGNDSFVLQVMNHDHEP